jgi:hypothetical protein
MGTSADFRVSGFKHKTQISEKRCKAPNPSTKLQGNFQTPNSKSAWNLELLWSLDVGAWSFFSSVTRHIPLPPLLLPHEQGEEIIAHALSRE